MEEKRFIVTCELGRLSKWLRIIGFDVVYERGTEVYPTIIKAVRENRVIITRNKQYAAHKGVSCFLLRGNDCETQLREVIEQMKYVLDEKKMFSRCVLCNAPLERIEKEKVKGKVPAYVYKTQEVFSSCPECERIYWEGSHWGNVKEILEKLKIL